MLPRHPRLVRLIYVVSDLLCVICAFCISYQLRTAIYTDTGILGPIFPFGYYWDVLSSSIALILILAYILGMYSNIEFLKPRDIASGAFKTTALGLAAVTLALFLFKKEYVSRSLLLVFFFLTFFMLAGVRWLLFFGTSWIRMLPQNHRNFVIVGTGEGVGELAALIENGQKFGLRLLAFLHPMDKECPQPSGLRQAYPMLPARELRKLLHERVVDEVIFAVGKDELPELMPLMAQCEKEGVHMRVHFDFLPKGFSYVFIEHLDSIPLLSFASRPSDDLMMLVKRVLDIIGAALALIVFSPVMLILGILIKFTSHGPMLFKQVRCGLGGRRFTLYKFRSMVVNAEEMLDQVRSLNEVDGPIFKVSDDPRCTWIGRWMRSLSLDELPQLWNVIRGDMSLVGPRPPLPDEVAHYEEWQRKRLRMRPGLTCLWVLEGRSRVQFERWVQLDLLYIDNWSIWLDFKIIAWTIPAVLSQTGAH